MISYLDHIQNLIVPEIQENINLCGNNAFNESVFRFFVVRQMKKSGRVSLVQSEIDRYDIVYMLDKCCYALELKFYTIPFSTYPSGKIKLKGGPTDGNFNNFKDQVEKIKGDIKLFDDTVINGKFIWMMYMSVDEFGNETKYNQMYMRSSLRNAFPEIKSTRNQKRITGELKSQFRTLVLSIHDLPLPD